MGGGVKKLDGKEREKTLTIIKFLTTHLLCYKCNPSMIAHFISLPKNRIKGLPGSLIGIVDGYSP